MAAVALRRIPVSAALAAALLLFSLCPIGLHALVFDLHSGRVKCVTEDLRAHSMSVAHYRVSDDGTSHEISVKVSDPKGESLHLVESVKSGKFAFVAEETGPHSACFWSPKFELSASVHVEFEWRTGVAARDWPSVAKKGKVEVMEMELKRMEESISSIYEEMVFLRERDEEMLKLNEATNSKMGLLSFLSLFLCLTVAGVATMASEEFLQKRKNSLMRYQFIVLMVPRNLRFLSEIILCAKGVRFFYNRLQGIYWTLQIFKEGFWMLCGL